MNGNPREPGTPDDPARERGTLERTLGPVATLTIGLGTMVGAGIFVFPGLAVGEAGPAAALSFALGAGIALLVALPTSELATAMPRSGGGYYFVSRAMGPGAGILVGLGQWVGLVFASAFYLAGFGHYAIDVFARFGLSVPVPPGVLGFGAATALTIVAVAGTRTSGRLQLWIVAVLSMIITAFLAWGAVRVTGLVGEASLPASFAPRGVRPILTTAALVFTSYLGFAQIANVAGEVRDPGRTLPRAMVGSVILVGLLYVVTVLVSTGVLGTEGMGAAGETALSEVGRALLGPAGALAIGAAGLLATLSSANASILGSSRTVFALSRDGLIPEGAGRVSRRFRTPHLALGLTGGPIALLALLGRIETLAEVASILHLIMYALICVSALLLRRGKSLWYRPAFRSPGGTWLPALGAALCLALLFFMSPRSLAYAGIVAGAIGMWHLAYARGTEIPGVEELEPAPHVAQAMLLLQMELPGPPGVPVDVVRALAPNSVVLLGWAQVPEQSSAEQVRDELGAEAEADLDAVADRLRELGMEVDAELVFTGDLVRTIDRTARDRDPDAILSLSAGGPMESILVVPGHRARSGAVAGYTARVALATDARVTVMLAGDGEGDGGESDSTALERHLLDAGLTSERIHTRSAGKSGDGPDASRITEAAEGSDLIVLGETTGEDGENTFGGLSARVTRDAGIPVLVVRAHRGEEIE